MYNLATGQYQRELYNEDFYRSSVIHDAKTHPLHWIGNSVASPLLAFPFSITYSWAMWFVLLTEGLSKSLQRIHKEVRLNLPPLLNS